MNRPKELFAFVVLVIGVLATIMSSLLVKQGIEREAERRFSLVCDQISLKIHERLAAYALILRGGAGLFAASNSVERQDWRAYVDTLQASKNIPGVQGVGFAQVIQPEKLAAHIAGIRGKGFPDYTVRPPGKRSLYTSIIYLEPFKDRNLRAFGFDMFSESVRRAAMEKARDTGEATLSGKVLLVQETEKEVQAGTLMYVPVYLQGKSVITVEQRREALIGWAYSPYRMNDLMTGILSNLENVEGKSLDMRIYDGMDKSPGNLLYGINYSISPNAESLNYQQRVVKFDKDNQWLIEFRGLDLLSRIDYGPVWSILVGGLTISLLLFWLMLSIINTRSNAAKIAGKLTEEIGQLNQRFALAADSAQIGVWDYLIPENKLIWDKWMFKLYGVREEDFAGAYEAWQNGLHPDDKVRGDNEIKQAMQGEKKFDTEFRVIWPTGELHYIKASALVIRNAVGEPQRMIGINYDITERRAAESNLIDRTEQLNAIFSLSPDGLVSFDQEHRVKYLNPAFSRLTGLPEEEVVGLDDAAFSEKLASLCIPSARFRGIDTLLPRDEPEPGGKPRRELIELSGPGSRVIEVGLRLSDAETVSQILYFRDVTYETEVDRMKSEFLSTAAHELRTPMASIYGFVEMLLMQEHKEATRHELLTIVHQQSELMANIINELLDIARIEARRGKDFVLETVALQDLVAEALAGYKVPVGHEAALVMPAAEPLYVCVDRAKISQAITNILSNAYKYSPGGRVVSVGFCAATAGGVQKSGVKIADHGIGMTPKQQARVFERFYRADTSGNIPGTGLGMSIVKEIVELHGGSLELASDFGVGTTITMWLPQAVS